MRYLGATIEQAANFFGWGEIKKFSQHLPIDSATRRAKNSELYDFASDLKRNAILADIVDALTGLAYALAKMSGGRPEKPKPYPRPWKPSNVQTIGAGAIPISEFDSWYYSKEVDANG